MRAGGAGRLGALAEELPASIAIGCDVGDPAALAQALDRAAAEGGDPKVLIHNAVGGAIGSFLDVEPSVLEANFHINVMALYHMARWGAERMKAQGGAILVTGNTSSERVRARFAGFAPTKAAKGILTDSIARALWTLGLPAASFVLCRQWDESGK